MYIKGISASSYDCYSWCEFRFYLQQVLGFEDESGPAAILGHIGHKVPEVLSRASINRHPKNSKIWDIEYLWRISFNHYYMNSPTGTEGIKNDKLVKVCRGLHDLLDGPYTPIRDNTISAEAMFNIAITEPGFIVKKENGETQYMNVRGRIDRVDKIDDETIEIIDYKTGTRTNYSSKERQKKDSIYLHEEIQPRMYHLAAQHMYPWAKNVLVTFLYITDGGPVTVPFCEEDIKTTKEMLRRRFQAIKANEDPQRNMSWKCKVMCSYGKDGTCDKVWEEKDSLGHAFIKNQYTMLNYGRRKS